jgi:hypothetical protein
MRHYFVETAPNEKATLNYLVSLLKTASKIASHANPRAGRLVLVQS